MLSKKQGPGAKTRWFVEFTRNYGVLLWVIALALGVLTTLRTITLYTHLRSEVDQLLPADAESVRALNEMRTRIQGLQYLQVVVDTGTEANVPAAEHFLDDLKTKIEAYPKDMVSDVRVGYAIEREYIERHLPLFLDLNDLREIAKRIEDRRDWEVSHASGLALDEDEKPPSVDMSDIQDRYKSKSDQSTGFAVRYTDRKRHLTMLSVEVGGFDTNANKCRRLLSRVKSDIDSLGGLDHYAHGMTLGYASDVPIQVEEANALEADLGFSSLIVIIAVAAVIVLYYRWWASVLVLIPPLILATTYAFSLASIPPISITELNSNTAFLGSIIIGNGINVGLILVARFREERYKGTHVEEALCIAVWGARTGTLTASMAAAVSYASLIITDFRGFRQFGFIGFFGMTCSWVTAFVLMPPMLRWLDSDKNIKVRSSAFDWFMRPIVWFVSRFPALVVVAGVVISLGCFSLLRHIGRSQIETDFSKLRRYDTWTVGDGYWGKKANDLLQTWATPTVVMTSTPEATERLAMRLRDTLKTESPLANTVAVVQTAKDFIPDQQTEKIAEAKSIREMLTPKIRSLIPEKDRPELERLIDRADLTTITPQSLPPVLARHLSDRLPGELEPHFGRSVLIYPRADSSQLWEANALSQYVTALRDIAKPEGAIVAGNQPLSHDIIVSIARDAPRATLISLIGVIVVLFMSVGLRRASLHVLASLMLGILWLGGLTMLFHVKINFANFIAFPITLGIGIDYAVNVITRYIQDGETDIEGAIKSTGAAVVLCSLTTIIGYSSLLFAKNQALHLFGVLAVWGELACLSTAILVMPSLLLLGVWLRRRLHPAHE